MLGLVLEPCVRVRVRAVCKGKGRVLGLEPCVMVRVRVRAVC